MANILRTVIENDKGELRKLEKIAKKVESYADAMAALSDEELQAKTPEFKKRYQNGETLDQLLPEAFAVVREAAKRVLGLYPYRVQIMGGIVMHNGDVPEMRTGEGKTLTATMPVYLNALAGEGVHVITVNEYLATRDATEMGELYSWLGLSVGINLAAKSPSEKREAYNCDITYSTNSEVGFDYLRDNMVVRQEDMVQRPLNFALVDEVDSVLIDEARTPLIVSGQVSSETSQLYIRADRFVKTLTSADYTIDVPTKTIGLTDYGIDKAEEYFHLENLYDLENVALTHYIDNALRANYIMSLDIDYVVSPMGEILIVDQFTGRTMEGRRFSDGLHQAIEAKEGVPIQEESKTSASITYQNMFRMYKKLAGMTGTAKTEEDEFREVYNMRVIPIPTNKPVARIDHPDLLYPTLDSKFRAVVADVKARHEKGQPVLIGTVSVETSDLISKKLVEAGVPHEVLNAKNHFKEAQIIMNAGQRGAVTIATNMAGRGTDIKLGEGVRELGGLCVIGTERHESRRIDNQLRGRSGRQGDPGSSRFYLSLEDGLMRIYLNEGKLNMMRKAFTQPGEAMESKLLAKVIASAQAKVEAFHFDGRKNLLEYDDVANDQRHAIYEQRNYLLDNDDISETIKAIRSDVFNDVIDQYIPPQSLEEQWDIKGLEERLAQEFGLELPIEHWLEENNNLHEENLRERIIQEAEDEYKAKEALAGEETMRHFEKGVMLQTLDELWKEHLAAMDYLRQGIHLRGYAQKDPKQEYKKESFRMFTEMLDSLKHHVITTLTRVKVRTQEEMEEAERVRQAMAEREAQTHHPVGENTEQAQSEDYSDRHIGRNEPCPCGSGKKYKHCHGNKARYA